MPVGTVVAIALILAGTSIMGASLYRFRALRGALPLVTEPTRSWLRRLIGVHAALVLFFLAGYLGTAAAFAFDRHFIGDVFVGLIFAFGALFVYLGLAIQSRLIREIVKTMGHFVPICASCKRIRLPDRNPRESAAWQPVETYFGEAHRTVFSHSICPECVAKFAPGLAR